MQMLIYFTILFFCAFAVAGLYAFFVIVTDYDKIFSFVQKILKHADRKMNTLKEPLPRMFWTIVFKSLGGCETCTRQRITEIVFAAISFLWHLKYRHGVYYGLPLHLRIGFQVMSFIIFIGMVTTWAMMLKNNAEAKKEPINYEPEQEPLKPNKS